MTDKSENSGPKQGGKFVPGTSGNPRGKPRGARNRTTLAIEALLEGQARKLTKKAVDMALAGDTTALRLCLERLAPPRKDRHVTFDLPPIASAKDHPAALAAVVAAVAAGQLTPTEAAGLAAVLEAHRRAVETSEILDRLETLEGRTA